MTFQAIVAPEPGPAQLRELTDADLPVGDVTVAVSHSSLNYKDGIVVAGPGRVARSYPMVCGIDLAGVVEESDSPDWQAGDEVLITGWGLSESHPGGYTQRQRVRSEWLTPKPAGFTLSQCMAIGTAGLTAMLCVLALEHAGVAPGEDHEVLVTGAGGGVGSVAVALLACSATASRPPRAARSCTATCASWGPRRSSSGRQLEVAVEAARERALGRRGRHSRLPDTGQRARADPLRRRRARRAAGPAAPICRRRSRPSSCAASSLLGIDSVMCPTPARAIAWGRLERDVCARAARRDDHGRADVTRAGTGGGDPRRADPRARRDRHGGLSFAARRALWGARPARQARIRAGANACRRGR